MDAPKTKFSIGAAIAMLVLTTLFGVGIWFLYKQFTKPPEAPKCGDNQHVETDSNTCECDTGSIPNTDGTSGCKAQCRNDETPCGNICANNLTQTCIDGVICSNNKVCGPVDSRVCCPENKVCDSSTNACIESCPTGQSKCGEICCNNGDCDSNGKCCPLDHKDKDGKCCDAVTCGGICCPTDQSCQSGECKINCGDTYCKGDDTEECLSVNDQTGKSTSKKFCHVKECNWLGSDIDYTPQDYNTEASLDVGIVSPVITCKNPKDNKKYVCSIPDLSKTSRIIDKDPNNKVSFGKCKPEDCWNKSVGRGYYETSFDIDSRKCEGTFNCNILPKVGSEDCKCPFTDKTKCCKDKDGKFTGQVCDKGECDSEGNCVSGYNCVPSGGKQTCVPSIGSNGQYSNLQTCIDKCSSKCATGYGPYPDCNKGIFYNGLFNNKCRGSSAGVEDDCRTYFGSTAHYTSGNRCPSPWVPNVGWKDNCAPYNYRDACTVPTYYADIGFDATNWDRCSNSLTTGRDDPILPPGFAKFS